MIHFCLQVLCLPSLYELSFVCRFSVCYLFMSHCLQILCLPFLFAVCVVNFLQVLCLPFLYTMSCCLSAGSLFAISVWVIICLQVLCLPWCTVERASPTSWLPLPSPLSTPPPCITMVAWFSLWPFCYSFCLLDSLSKYLLIVHFPPFLDAVKIHLGKLLLVLSGQY